MTNAPSIGMPTAKENMGKLANSGIELQARVVAVTIKNGTGHCLSRCSIIRIR